jgi:hypothetical protein
VTGPYQSAGPRHCQEVVTGEELGTGDDCEDQSKGEAEPAHQPGWPEAERGLGNNNDEKQSTKRNECARKDGQDQQRESIRLRLGDAETRDAMRNLGRGVSVNNGRASVHSAVS